MSDKDKYKLVWIDQSFHMNIQVREGSLKEIEEILKRIQGCTILSMGKVEQNDNLIIKKEFDVMDKIIVTELEYENLQHLLQIINDKTATIVSRKIAKARYLATIRFIRGIRGTWKEQNNNSIIRRMLNEK